jgi:hypothetical protein
MLDSLAACMRYMLLRGGSSPLLASNNIPDVV